MTSRLPRLRAAIYATPWAILPDRLEAIAEVVERRAEGIRFTPEEIAALRGARPPGWLLAMVPMALDSQRPGSGGQGGNGVIAVIPIAGIIAQHASQVDNISGPGTTSTERLTQTVKAAVADPSVKAIVLNIDSPGGGVYGVQEAADVIYQARGSKPIIAQVNSLAASAAYWLATSADEIVVTPSGEVGSIGVFGAHKDESGADERAGVKYTLISAGRYKTEGNPYGPLTEDGISAMQSNVNRYYGMFVRAVARGRKVNEATVRGGFGEGRVVGAGDAVQQGMADRIGTLDETLRRLGGRATTPNLAAIEAPQTLEAHDDDWDDEAQSQYLQQIISGSMLTANEADTILQAAKRRRPMRGTSSVCPNCGYDMTAPPATQQAPADGTPTTPPAGQQAPDVHACEAIPGQNTANSLPMTAKAARRSRKLARRRERAAAASAIIIETAGYTPNQPENHEKPPELAILTASDADPTPIPTVTVLTRSDEFRRRRHALRLRRI